MLAACRNALHPQALRKQIAGAVVTFLLGGKKKEEKQEKAEEGVHAD
jgi:hypothetical protein